MAGIPNDCGHRDYLMGRTDRALASNPMLSPAAKARILGKPRPHQDAKEHWIVVDLKAGTRTVEGRQRPIPPKAKRIPPTIRLTGCRDPIFRNVLRAICDAYDTTADALLMRGKSMKLAYARFAGYRLLRHHYHWTPEQTARAFERDHSTIAHGVDRAIDLHAGNADWRNRYETALAELKAGAP